MYQKLTHLIFLDIYATKGTELESFRLTLSVIVFVFVKHYYLMTEKNNNITFVHEIPMFLKEFESLIYLGVVLSYVYRIQSLRKHFKLFLFESSSLNVKAFIVQSCSECNRNLITRKFH